MKYAGLTDDPRTRRMAHGNPIDWIQRRFDNEEEAREWEEAMLSIGYQGCPGGSGWSFGYIYTIAETTVQ